MRALARQLFVDALEEVSIERAFQRHLECGRGLLRVKEDLYDLGNFSRVFAVAMGKAARIMAKNLQQQMGARLSGILIEPEASSGQTDAQPMLAAFRHFRGGHPLPNQGSLQAAKAVLQSLHYHMQNALVIFMISGGASAMIDKPLDDEIALRDLVAAHQALIFSGAPIAEVNAIRKHLSAVKGGRLAVAAHAGGAARQVSVMISDVPDTTPDALASGPTMPDSTTVEDCYAIAERYQLRDSLPLALRQMFERKLLAETPKSDDLAFHNSRWSVLLSNVMLRDAVATAAAFTGFAVEVDNTCDDWDYARAADYLLGRLRELRQGVSRVCLISGGEVTVRIPPDCNPGIGGRNQQFALYCAEKIAGENITVLSAGSDGIDGNSPAAGGIVDGSTLQRALDTGGRVEDAVREFNAFPLLKSVGDDITTGPTGTNLRDLRILLAY